MGLPCRSWPCWSVSKHLMRYGINLSKLAVLISVRAFDEVWDYLVEVGRVDQFLRIWQCMGLPCRSWPCRSVSEHLTMYGINLLKMAVSISVWAFDAIRDYLVKVGRVDQCLRIWRCMGLTCQSWPCLSIWWCEGLPCRSWPCRSVSEHLTMYGINLSKLAV
jgi:hypothetical protein